MTHPIDVIAVRAVLLLGVAIIALVLAEGVLHLLVPRSSGHPYLFTPQSMRYKVMKPSHRVIIYGVPFQTNEFGFRDKAERLPARSPHEKRIIVLGDSYSICAGVPFESLYTAITERELARLSSSTQVRVLNLATGGYNVLQYWYTLTESGLALSPDFVVVAIVPVLDFDRMGLYEECRRIAMGGEPSKPGWIERLYVTRVFWQRAYNLLLRALQGSHTSPGASEAPDSPQISGLPDERQINQQALLDIQSALVQRHIPLLVAFLPEIGNFHKQQAGHSELADFCRAHEIDYFDTLPAFISDGNGPGHYGLNIIDNHPNARYNQIVAKELTGALADRLKALETRT